MSGKSKEKFGKIVETQDLETQDFVFVGCKDAKSCASPFIFLPNPVGMS